MSSHEASAPQAQPHCASSRPVEGEPLIVAALRILDTASAAEKASLTHETARMWRDKRLQWTMDVDDMPAMPAVPARPARDKSVSSLPHTANSRKQILPFKQSGRLCGRLSAGEIGGAT